ncbi:MAG: HEAT repeat domain-containing protein [Candidatus Bathyarchaeia archaeon]|nr:HEAT repeat domain-containing protein [Candidatus Bathyarchaeia archaeon]
MNCYYPLQVSYLASQAERDAIEQILINHSPRDWRDIEALAEINTKCARETIKEAIKDPNPVIRVAVTRFAPDLVTDNERTQSITDALKNTEAFSGLSQVLDEVKRYHPQEVKEALIKGSLTRKGEVAVHFAAILFYLFGKAKEPFDWGKRPFFLRFNTEDRKERVKVFRELCQKLKINPEKYLRQKQELFKI